MAGVNREQLLNCALCPNMCRSECPAVKAQGREAVAPSGKARLAASFLGGYLSLSGSVLEALSTCLGCRGCTIYCPFPELNLCDELLFSRLGAEASKVSLPVWSPYLNNLKKYGSPYGRKTERTAIDNKEAEVVFFAGCTSLANNPGSSKAARRLLEMAGVSYLMIDEDCCGYPAETWGDIELARQLAAENRRKIAESGASVLVTSCPECWVTFTQRYPDWGKQLTVEIVDSPGFFLGLIEEGRLVPKKEFKGGCVTYHDPCVWARTAEKVAEPRKILEAIPGLKIAEAEHNGEKTRCCGGGRMFQLTWPETASAIARQRLCELPQPGAIVTACPFCCEALKEDGRQVLELIEVLAASCE